MTKCGDRVFESIDLDWAHPLLEMDCRHPEELESLMQACVDFIRGLIDKESMIP